MEKKTPRHEKNKNSPRVGSNIRAIYSRLRNNLDPMKLEVHQTIKIESHYCDSFFKQLYYYIINCYSYYYYYRII